MFYIILFNEFEKKEIIVRKNNLVLKIFIGFYDDLIVFLN